RAAAESLFSGLVRSLESLRERTRSDAAISWPELERLVTTVLDSLERSGELFWVANRTSAPPGMDFVAFHMARVAVLAMRVGGTVGLGRPALVELGMAGCLIDVGLWQLPPALLKPVDALGPDGQKLYRTHPRLGADVIRRWSPPFPGLVDVVLQHHEREQGQGYPQGLGSEAIQPHAKILGLVDTYTQLTVAPGFEPGVRPHEAIREIVRTKHASFPPSLVKALLNEISVFPPGTLVRLNSGEVGRVIGVNRNHPLRPRVDVYDARGHRLAVPKIIDLSEAPFLYITGPVAETAR
ncbi:MAG: HD-GYP domain-containing protein, partial [Candidatus Rokuibacteriota bacterium]